MDQADIEKLGPSAYARTMGRLKRARVSRAVIVGFDTEYESQSGKLLSVQLSHSGNTIFQPLSELTPEILYDLSLKLIGTRVDTIEYASYWSLAEMQHLPVWLRGVDYREYANSFECSFRVGRASLRIYDVARWFLGSPLRLAAKTIGEEKLEWDTKTVTLADVGNPRFRAYAVHDATLAESLLTRIRETWLDQEGIDILIYRTPAGATAASFRQTLSADVAPPPSRARYVALKGVWGGRAEAFQHGRFPKIYEYDLTSAYPSALAAFTRVPTGKDWKCAVKWSEVRKHNGYIFGTFSFPPGLYTPCLPVSHGGSLLYPLSGRTTATVKEWALAYELGAKVDVCEAWYYTSGDETFPRWIAGLLTRRQATTGLQNYVLKLQANAIIGKLAQRIHRVSLERLRQAAEEMSVPLDFLVSLSSEEQAIIGIEETIHPGGSWWPEVNGLVTGAVRARIGRLIAQHQSIYCATDSIWTLKPISQSKLPRDLTLKRHGPGEVWRTRVARIQGAGAGPEAGRPDKADHVVHHAWASRLAAWNAMRGGTTSYEVNRPVKPRESLRRKRKMGSFLVETRVGTLSWCGKRRLLPSGDSVPWKNTAEYDQWCMTEKRGAKPSARRAKRV